MATVALALIEPSLDSLQISLAGHPAPILATGDIGTYLDLPVDPPLGVRPSAGRRSATVELPVGSVLALYTDGLIERRATSIDARIELLCASVAARPAEDVCVTVMANLVGPRPPSDDIALLAIRRLDPTTSAPDA
jgi:serine phosphatase RsbU (regulator of sigma subunit)